MNFTAYIARAFCHNSLGGNSAGVVLVDQQLPFSSSDMQSIAAKLNFSETVFISPLCSSTYKALYFTPTSSIEFCGHATLAAFGVLKHLGLLESCLYSLETQGGKCEVTLKDDSIFLSQFLPVFGEKIAKDLLIAILQTAEDKPYPRIVSTGLPDIFVRVSDKKSLNALQPNFQRMSELNRKTHSVGVHAFCLNPPGSATTAYCRNFAPSYGIEEESATGSSNGALACYLFKKGYLLPDSKHKLLFKQGYSLNAPSDIYVHLNADGNTITKVECGGKVVVDEARHLKAPLEK